MYEIYFVSRKTLRIKASLAPPLYKAMLVGENGSLIVKLRTIKVLKASC